jgi:carbamoylphosphate synthase large subunit
MPLIAPFNVQFRYSDNCTLNLLEVNTRLSGGSWKAKELGYDFAKLTVDKFLDKPISFENGFETLELSSLEGYVRL